MRHNVICTVNNNGVEHIMNLPLKYDVDNNIEHRKINSRLKVLPVRVFQGRVQVYLFGLFHSAKKNNGGFIFRLLQLFWAEQRPTLFGIR